MHNAYSIAHAEHSFDKLRYERIFQHLDTPRQAIAEARRLLKPGGQLQIVDADYFSLNILYPHVHVERMLVDHLVNERLPNSHRVRLIPQYLADAGFAVTGVEIHPLVITDPKIALRVIRFDEIVKALTLDGSLNQEQGQSLQNCFGEHTFPFNLSMNELIISARVHLV